MENCEYTRILADVGIEINGCKEKTWKPMLRQCLISSGVCCVYFLHGLFLGAPTVLIAQIKNDVNSTEVIDDEMMSWLTTLPLFSSVSFFIILLVLFNKIGRKFTFLFVWLIEIIAFIILYCSTSINQVLISELFAGVGSAASVTIAPIIIAEYTSAKYRGIFLTLKGASAFWGIWISNLIGTFFYWKNIAVVAFVCSVYLISVIVWPESPYWLAKRGRYAEVAKSHRWLKGSKENEENELSQLIFSQKDLNNLCLPVIPVTGDRKNSSNFFGLSRIMTVIKSRDFYQPTLICMILFAQYNFTGKFVITMYAIEVLKRLSPDISFVYKTMLILDGVTVFSTYIGCVISRYCKRRTLLLLFSGTGITVLYILSTYLYLASLSLVTQYDVAILALLTLFSISISCGPMILCTSIYGEIVPFKHQNLAMIFVSSSGIIFMSALMKFSPLLFKYFKMHGSFLFFAISSTIILGSLYFLLPETKDKTIQDIEKLFSKTKSVNLSMNDNVNEKR